MYKIIRFDFSILVCYDFPGTQFGTVVALLLSGLLADEFGWEWVFYFFGILGCVWVLAWTFICHDSPAKHPRISEVSHELYKLPHVRITKH
jgi:MFS family permease